MKPASFTSHTFGGIAKRYTKRVACAGKWNIIFWHQMDLRWTTFSICNLNFQTIGPEVLAETLQEVDIDSYQN